MIINTIRREPRVNTGHVNERADTSRVNVSWVDTSGTSVAAVIRTNAAWAEL